MASIGKLSILIILIETTVFVTNTFGIVKIFNTLHSNDFHQNICMYPFGFLFLITISPLQSLKNLMILEIVVFETFLW